MISKRKEYPRPQFRRDEWMSLNGEWEFAYDDAKDGEKRKYHTGKVRLNKTITVPYTYQYPASGIGDTTPHSTVWYRKSFQIEKSKHKKRALLCFNACDYETDVWVNGNHAVKHVGGYTPFSADVTQYLKPNGENTVVVRCKDPTDPTIPRGKQSWLEKPFSCWYVPNTGIWQSVWMEFTGEDAVQAFSLIPDIDTCSFKGEITTMYGIADEIQLDVYYDGNRVKTQRQTTDGKHTRYTVSLMEADFVDEKQYWTPEKPNLFYVDVMLYVKGKCVDKAHTRFGMRKVSIDNEGKITLNNRRLYQRLVLDQGYWKESGITPPSVEAIRHDIEMAKAMGFNGARKHQKFEDPYFYYLAEEIGFLTWCEMPSAYNFNADMMYAQTKEWQEIVNVARNFTSVVCYVPLNESWGTRKIINDENQQNYGRALYYMTHAIDGSRPVSTNDGWECLSATDVLGIHDYAYSGDEFKTKYNPENYDTMYPQGRKLMAEGNVYQGQPVLLTEFGGIAMQSGCVDGNWGYNSGAKTAEEFYARLTNLMKGIYECDFCGYCYTQLTDVQQEINGLLDENHEPKFDNAKLKNIFEND
ncbi:MAG: glycoside hydrolase family 2 [Clostridiales bacterium]|nr:glycoside hydrolase family 2 [Clostridiales bacterium]